MAVQNEGSVTCEKEGSIYAEFTIDSKLQLNVIELLI